MKLKLHDCPCCGAHAVVEEEINIFQCQLCGERFNEQEMGLEEVDD